MSEESKRKNSASRKGKCLGANNHMFGKPHSEEIRNKISKTKTGVANPLKRKPVNQLDPETREIIRRWDSGWEAAEALSGNKKNSSTISACAKGQHGHKTAFGFAWEYAESVNTEEPS